MPLALHTKFRRFVIVGVIATLLQYGLLVVCVRACHLSATWGSAIGFAVSAFVNYALNYRYTFRSSRTHRSASWRFVVVASSGLLVNVLLMQLLNARLGLHYLLAQVITTAVVLAWNFVGGAFWSFADQSSSKGGAVAEESIR